jgi:hypothetical protein
LDIIKAAKEKEMISDFERKNTEITQSQATKVASLQAKFGTGGTMDFIEEHLQSTGVAGGVGLVTHSEYLMRKERLELTIAEEEEKMVRKELQQQGSNRPTLLNKRDAKFEQKKATSHGNEVGVQVSVK